MPYAWFHLENCPSGSNWRNLDFKGGRAMLESVCLCAGFRTGFLFWRGRTPNFSVEVEDV